jgi:hypothetical protein
MSGRFHLAAAFAAGLALAQCPSPAKADSIADIYKGKQINWI